MKHSTKKEDGIIRCRCLFGGRGKWILILLGALLGVATMVWRRDGHQGFLCDLSESLFTPPPIERIFNKSMEEQLLYLSGITRDQENAYRLVEKFPAALRRLLLGREIAERSPTRMKEFSVPSRSTQGHAIPVSCICPLDVSPNSHLPLVMYFHWGGLIFGSVATELLFAQTIAGRVSAVVCSVEYRTAPLHPHPAALDDAVDASLSLIGTGDETDENYIFSELGVNVDRDRVATFGISAGGYLSAQTARVLAHEGVSTNLQVSLVPMAKPHGGTRSILNYWRDHWISGPMIAYSWSAYLPGDDGTLAGDWKVNLLVDPDKETISRLPVAYVEIHTRDVLRDEGEMYAHKLKAQGKLLELVEYDTTHIGGVPPASKGGPGDGSYERAVEAMVKVLQGASNGYHVYQLCPQNASFDKMT